MLLSHLRTSENPTLVPDLRVDHILDTVLMVVTLPDVAKRFMRQPFRELSIVQPHGSAWPQPRGWAAAAGGG